MLQTTVRVTRSTHALLKKMARAESRPMQAILEEAVEEHRRRLFLESVNSGYAGMKQEGHAWPALLRERAIWESVDSSAEPVEPGAARRIRSRSTSRDAPKRRKRS